MHNSDFEVADVNAPPNEYLCPITQELIVDPVLCAGKLLYFFVFFS